MHRTHFVPCLLGWGALLLTLAMFFGPAAISAHAQPGGPMIDQNATVITMGIGTSQTYFSKFALKEVNNDSPKVLMVRGVPGKADQVIFEAIAPGRARVRIVDEKGNKDLIEVIVISDRVKELRDLISRTLPTASVTVNSTDAGTIVLSGYVLTSDDSRTVAQLAAAIGGNVVNNVRIGGVQQVQLEVVVAIVNRSDARNLAFSWNVIGNNWFVNSLFGTPLGLTQVLTPFSPSSTTATLSQQGSANISFSVLNGNSSVMGFLQALRTEGLTKILAEPRVTTLSGRPAYILSGGETPILTSGGTGTPSVSYKQFGTVVNFLPIVLGNGKIHLEVNPQISNLNQAAGINIPGVTPTVIPGFDSRAASVAVQIEDGQTLAIGGLIQNRTTGSISRVPILGDIPGVGMLFSQSSYSTIEEEMLILVTPRLVDPVDCCKIPKWLPGRETRIPDDFEFFCELILEAPRGPRQVGMHPHTYEPAFKGAPNIGQYPCANGSCGHNGNCSTGNCGSTGNCNATTSAPRFGSFGRNEGGTTTSANTGVVNTAPRISDVPAIPASSNNFRVNDSDPLPAIPSVMPTPVSGGPPTLGVPAIPVPSAREFDARPPLPPLPSNPR